MPIASAPTTRTALCSCVFDRRRAIRVWINLSYWNSPSTTADRRQSTVFHELMHAVLKLRHNPNLDSLRQNDRAHYREIDRVEACQSMCFDPTNATKCSCATCTGESSCQFCSTYKTCTTNQLGAYCNCKANTSAYLHWYNSITQCTVSCPQGLSCFASNSCLQEVNTCR